MASLDSVIFQESKWGKMVTKQQQQRKNVSGLFLIRKLFSTNKKYWKNDSKQCTVLLGSWTGKEMYVPSSVI